MSGLGDGHFNPVAWVESVRDWKIWDFLQGPLTLTSVYFEWIHVLVSFMQLGTA